jgi:hypothetical protein
MALGVGVLIIVFIWIRSDPTRYDPKINESDMDLIFLIWIGSGSDQPDPTWSENKWVGYFKVILWLVLIKAYIYTNYILIKINYKLINI